MKTKLKRIQVLLVILLLSFLESFAQAPQAISYQAVARNSNGDLITSQQVSLRFSIRDLIPAGTVLYSETHSATTNAFGLFSLSIGQGTIVSGSMTSIDWKNGSKFLQVELDASAGSNYLDMGTSMLLSVPYALYAGTSNVPDGNQPGHTLHWNGSEWIADGSISNDGTSTGIGAASGVNRLGVSGNQNVGVNYMDDNAPVNGLIVEGQTGIGTPLPDPSAMLDITSSDKGLLIPRMSTAQRNAIVNPAPGLIVFDSTENNLFFFSADIDFNTWIPIININNFPSGNTLDEAYDEGGPGNGRIITVDAGSVEMNASGANKALVIRNTNEDGIDVGVYGSGDGINVESWTGNGININMPFGGQAIHADGNGANAQNLISARTFNSPTTGAWYDDLGRAGLFRNISTSNNRPALQAQTYGTTFGVMGISGDFTSTTEIIPVAGTAGISFESVARNGLSGFSKAGIGAWGKTLVINTWSHDPSTYKPGVYGTSSEAEGISGGPSDFYQGVTGYIKSGAGVLGINGGFGHGVLGVTKSFGIGSQAGVWGAVQTTDWTSHTTDYPFVDGAFAKGPVGVLAQSKATVAAWTESQERIGLVTTTGMKKGIGDLALPKAALIAISTQVDATTVGIFNENAPPFPALRIVSTTAKGGGVLGQFAFDVLNNGTGGGANIITADLVSTSSSLNVSNAGDGFAGRFQKTNAGSVFATVFATTAGMGKAGAFEIENPGSMSEALTGKTAGDGPAGGFLNSKLTNPSPALTATTLGTGHAAKFMGVNPGAVGATVDAMAAGGKIANFVSTHTTSTDNAVAITHASLGKSLKIENTHPAPGVPMGVAATALSVESALGPVAHFDSKYVGFSSPGPIPPATSPVVLVSSSSMLQTGIRVTTTPFGGTNAKAADLDGDVDITGKVTVGTSIALGSGPGSTLIGPSSISSGVVTVGTISPMGGLATVSGSLHVAATLTAGVKSFEIDHPLDPDNKFLRHACIESDEIVNIYSGNVQTDKNGFVNVQLPKWMNALNKDFKYQLTILGKTFAQAIIFEEIDSDGKFKIQTSIPETKVSWQVIGVRHDDFVIKNPLIVEENKNSLSETNKNLKEKTE